MPYSNASPEALLITQENVALLKDNYPYTMNDLVEREPAVAVIADGKAVALSCTVRLTEHAAEAGLSTEPDYQGRGYGALARQTGGICACGKPTTLYSTAWDNLASQGVARKLGAVSLRLHSACTDSSILAWLACRTFDAYCCLTLDKPA